MREGLTSEFGDGNPAYANEIDGKKELLKKEFNTLWNEVINTAPPEVCAELKEHFDPQSLAEAENAEQIVDVTAYLQERIDEAKSKYPELKFDKEHSIKLPKWVFAAVSLVAMLNVAFASPNIAMAAPTSQHEKSAESKRKTELENNKHHTIKEAIEFDMINEGFGTWDNPYMGYQRKFNLHKELSNWATGDISFVDKDDKKAISNTTIFLLKNSNGNWKIVYRFRDESAVLSEGQIKKLGIPHNYLKSLGIVEWHEKKH